MSLLNKIITSSLAENKAIKELHDISYSAINGQRQEVKNYQPEGVIMLGQLSHEKPLDAITKEMIEDYHQKEQELLTAPTIVNGRPMKYKGVNYELHSEAPVETKVLTDDINELVGDRVYVSNDIRTLSDEIKKTDDNVKGLINEVNETGYNFRNTAALNSENRRLENLQKQLKEKNKLYEFIENTIKTNEIKKKDIDKENAIIAQRNKSKLMQYERDLQQINRNRLNLQQQPNESEAQYYQRLKEIEKERYDPVLYKQRALNQNVIELKDKLGDLFEDTSFKENIIKNLSDEDKYLLNQSFDASAKNFLDKYGYNNKSLNSKMVIAELVKPAQAISRIQKIFRGNKVRKEASALKEREIRKNRRIREREVFKDTIARGQEQRGRARLAEEDERQDRAERVAQIMAAPIATREQIQRLGAREQAEIEARRRTDVLLAEAARERQAREAQGEEERRRQIISMSEQEARARAREREEELIRIRAAKKLQAALRNKKVNQNYQNELNLNRINAEAAAQREEMARQAAIENLNQQNQEYIQNRQNEYRKIKAANTLSNAWRNRQANHRFVNEYVNKQKQLAEERARAREREAQAASTLSNAWRNRQANYQFINKYVNKQKQLAEEAERQKYLEEGLRKAQAETLLKAAARRQVYNREWAEVLPEARRNHALWEKAKKLRNTQNKIAFSNLTSQFRKARDEREEREEAKQAFDSFTSQFRKARAARTAAEMAAEEAETERINQLVAASEAAEAAEHRRKMDEYLSAIQKRQAVKRLQSAARRGQAMREYPIRKDLEAVRNRDYSLASDEDIEGLSVGAALSEELAALASLSGASTLPQGEALNPARRTDAGIPRGTYEPLIRERKQQAAKQEKAAERKSLREAKKAERERLKAIAEEEGPAKRGKGLLRKPRLTKRKLVIKPEEKLKNRLRLVASQIEAGNTNPKLIIEVNDLYKQLYNIDNAYQYLSKNK